MRFKFSGYSIVLISIIVLILGMAVILLFVKPRQPKKLMTEAPMKIPVFRKDGELRFLEERTHRLLAEAPIEVALTPETQANGLMYRQSLPDSAAMLFVFKEQEPMNFWMKNTSISLDIIYADSSRKIVTIARRTVPFSEVNIPSDVPALYAVEVNAGYADRLGLKEGDFIDFTY
jgi:uncharacterized protein